jgi:hypothetical protein
VKRSIVLLLALVALAACGKTAKNDAPPDPSAAGASSAFIASSAVPEAAAPKAAATTWSLKYTLAPADMYVSEQDKKSVHFKNDPDKYVGDGTISLTVQPDGQVTGASDAPPLGPTLIAGLVHDGELTATVRRTNPSDEGLTGTITAKIAGDKLDGTAKLAESNAAVVREAKISGTKK